MGIGLLVGALSGMAAMYLFDPRTGRRRRVLIRDQLVKWMTTASDRAEAVKEEAINRAQGVAAETMRHLKPEDASDETLVARVRSEMGRYVSHPKAVTVTASNGHVELSGHILAQEVQALVTKVKSMSGVEGLTNQLKVLESASNIPALQGGRTRTELQ